MSGPKRLKPRAPKRISICTIANRVCYIGRLDELANHTHPARGHRRCHRYCRGLLPERLRHQNQYTTNLGRNAARSGEGAERDDRRCAGRAGRVCGAGAGRGVLDGPRRKPAAGASEAHNRVRVLAHRAGRSGGVRGGCRRPREFPDARQPGQGVRRQRQRTAGRRSDLFRRAGIDGDSLNAGHGGAE